jgi:signal transduction histidine kinase
MAADVHDLIMQDLALALATARMLVDHPARESQARVVVAAGERALAGARDVVNGLASHDRKPIVEAVEASVRNAARNALLTFHEKVPASVAPDQPTREALIHIGREAVTNAIKHADPLAVEVVLEYGEQWRLMVRDDGRGFDATGARAHPRAASGFGLESMRDRAHALGGSLRVNSAAGQGTTLEATLP